MSQIKFDTTYQDRDVEVMTGWDPPLGYYHLTVFDKDPNTDDEVCFDTFSKLGFCRNLNAIKQMLMELNIKPPPETFNLVEKREGNVIYKWNGEESVWTKKTL
jgi:hypothetical protein